MVMWPTHAERVNILGFKNVIFTKLKKLDSLFSLFTVDHLVFFFTENSKAFYVLENSLSNIMSYVSLDCYYILLCLMFQYAIQKEQ